MRHIREIIPVERKKVVIFVNFLKLYINLTDWPQSPFIYTCKNQVLELPKLQETYCGQPIALGDQETISQGTQGIQHRTSTTHRDRYRAKSGEIRLTKRN